MRRDGTAVDEVLRFADGTLAAKCSTYKTLLSADGRYHCDKQDSSCDLLLLLAEPAYRPFKHIDEVPKDALFKGIRSGVIYRLLGWNSSGISINSGYFYLLQLFDEYQMSLDQGKTWTPAGVEE